MTKLKNGKIWDFSPLKGDTVSQPIEMKFGTKA